MTTRYQRRLAADILKCGKNRVWIDPSRLEDVEEAITRSDIRFVIREGAIRAKQKSGISRGRAEWRKAQKKKGRRRGIGSRRGAMYARLPRKERWQTTIRALRKHLREMRDTGQIDRSVYRQYYRKAKGGMFKSRAHIEAQLRLAGLLKEPVRSPSSEAQETKETKASKAQAEPRKEMESKSLKETSKEKKAEG